MQARRGNQKKITACVRNPHGEGGIIQLIHEQIAMNKNDIPQTRASLILKLCQRSEDAWQEFLAVYENALYRFCLSKGLQQADCQDVLQEVLTAVIKKLPSWDRDLKKGRFRGWLFVVARNIAVDIIDQKVKRATGSGDTVVGQMLAEVADKQSATEPSFDVEYRRVLFYWACRQVKSEVKDITWQSFCETAIGGEDAASVAEKLEIPVGSVYTAKCRVVARIRNKIAELDDQYELEIETRNRLD